MKVPDIDTSKIQEILNIVRRLDNSDFHTLKKMTHTEIKEIFENALVDIEKLQDFVEVLSDEGICEKCEEATAGFVKDRDNRHTDGTFCAECVNK